MAKKIKTVEELQEYLSVLLGKAEHHAKRTDSMVGVDECVPDLSFFVLKYKNPEKPIEVLVKNNEVKNVAWVTIGRNKVVLSYNHDACKIEVRDKTWQGDVLLAVDNDTDMKKVNKFFYKMASGM